MNCVSDTHLKDFSKPEVMQILNNFFFKNYLCWIMVSALLDKVFIFKSLLLE